MSSGLMALGGLGQGLQAGVESYYKARGMENDREKSQQMMGLLAREHGLMVDPDTGAITVSPEGAEDRASKLRAAAANEGLIKAHTRYFNSWSNERDRKPTAGGATDPKTSDKIDKYSKALQRDMDPDTSRTGIFGQISSKLIQAQALKKLATDANGDIANLPGPQMTELALGMARMLSGGGVAAESTIHSLVPQSLAGNAEGLASWLLNEPRGRNQQEFVKQMMGTIDREADLASSQMADIRKKRLGAHMGLKKLSPETYNKILSKYGVVDDEDGATGANQTGAGLLAAPGAQGKSTPMVAPQDALIRQALDAGVDPQRIKAAIDAGYTPQQITEELTRGRR